MKKGSPREGEERVPVATLSAAIKAGYAPSLLGSAGLAVGLRGDGPAYILIFNPFMHGEAQI